MALRTTITERQRRLGVELRKLRERAGLSAVEAGEFIGMGRAHLSHVEGGRTAIPSDSLRTLCQACGCTCEPYIEALIRMSENTGKGWWSAYRRRENQSALDLAELEAAAATIRSHETLFIPGLFQTEDYIRAILASVEPVRSTVDDVTAFRLERQSVLTGEAAPTVHAVIHESALHMHFGGADVMRSQLVRLIELARLPNVTIQVIPFRADAYAAFSGPFLHLAPALPELGTVLLDHPAKALLLRDPDDLAKYQAMFDRLERCALPPIDPTATPESHAARDSLGLIQHILYAL
ncbi:helix-turn-helix domain-containing protein [Actinacidiphila oryziradicis]|uniref:Helix-turn-helix domain-containing protein n=1 Tax=Actinacidiphila oryziradicis TaxID=2571141 RepID=A0A4U0SLK6_9ACTN|nr:helix-turn-helix domain-containing protein [Actinacidiphila oryziradicis]